ncbi:MAG: ABC transporter substrate-binding protein [Tissierellia bacterium]|nr:ABC transporter substrate-binding protein [Tissierellia bacterium]
MKKNLRKKALVSLFLGLTMALVGCSQGTGSNKTNTSPEEEKTLKIGVVQLAEHVALDRARQGFEEELQDQGIKAEIIYENAQGELPSVMTISKNFIKEEVDLVYAIATPAAQGAQNALADTDIPLIFNAVTDPVDAGLVESLEKPGGQVTGVSDYIGPKDQLKAFVDLFPEIKTLGVLYSTNEANSARQIEDLEAACDELGIELMVKGINNINDASPTMASIVTQIDGHFAITDNMTSSSAAAIGKILKENKIPSYAAEEGPVESGLLLSDGVSYQELGHLAGRQAIDILVEGKSISDMPVGFAENTTRVVNEEVAQALGLDLAIFKEAKFVKTRTE